MSAAPRRTVVIGGGAAGLGAAGGVKAADPGADVVVYTEFEDVAYSPCGIPYVHGGEIPDFERLFLAGKQAYVDAGIDVHYETAVTAIDTAAHTVTVAGEGAVRYDSLVIATGWNYADPGVPGGDLQGLYYVKNIRKAMEWDKVISETKAAVVVEAGPLGLEMVTALAHRGVETHLIDPNPYALSMMADPDIMAPVEESWRELGVHLHFNTTLEEFLGDAEGKVRAVKTSGGEITADLVVISTHKTPETALAEAAGLKLGSTGAIIVDERMKTSAPDVWAAGDVVEIPHGLTRTPLQGLTGSHAYAQGKTAGTNAGGGDRSYRAVYVPWGTPAGKWVIGGASFGEATATALGIPYVKGEAQGISRARYYPGVQPVKVKLLAEPGTLRLIGAQMIGGGEGIKERADFLAQAIRFGMTLHDLSTMENVYSPAIGALNEPIVVAATNGVAAAKGK
ncbi:FAD-dependent oxidoreductase [Pseudonocardia sp. KRD-184]|uniref:FAD-dependent oxidoreductase n=1 Tax=Pseudonocardia oceani TaxID=2792013 RepID=A0ABS6U8Q9_9PSEU|nr:FAD-dependent oxidoreductase [Pseudonocardia oceani]MBW0089449.1 FAD-dependent oxidoreductase [Pseudonocardia oceani]MBW0096455.1 FAD-dependent oxidoreductase [Pseudonocardia oceani]MBW0109149.1 FAD-dependent oxidoreductase [Pseudonocardia oceani]MBW0120698.1 FAD-dependent oxidoreductase [Pseudonocardia oceani]MBW0128368.1 FAD-dependent oxidoreductase [Pseudonocardia oceani]